MVVKTQPKPKIVRWKNIAKRKTIKGWETIKGEEEEEWFKVLEQINRFIGIDDSINEIVIRAEDPYGNPYTLVIKWDPKKMTWLKKLLQ